MLLFWVFVAMATLLVTVVLVRPLLRRDPPVVDEAGEEERQRLAVYRDRRREIDRERASGRLAPDEAELAQRELLRQLATDLPTSSVSAPTRRSVAGVRGVTGITAAALIVLVPASAFMTYQQVGAPALLEARPPARATSPQPPLGHPTASPQLPPGHPTTTAMPSESRELDTLVAGIEQRTREAPEDGEAWAMLGAALKMQGRHQDAVLAFEQAMPRVEPDARLLAETAESVAVVAGGSFAGRPIEMLERALTIDDREPRALWLMAAAQFRAGDLPRARHYLLQLREGMPAGSADATEVGRILDRIEARMPSGAPTPAVLASSTAAPDTGRRAAAQQATGTIVAGTVLVDPGLAAQAERGGTLFVIARQADGPPIPVAVRREPGASLPMSFELGDANAMNPSRLLSSAGVLSLEARLSRSGEAQRRAGDLYGSLASVEPGSHDLRIVIDRVVGNDGEAANAR
ncbi:MAG: c-type cytochrome biogenesis protein CcmI [Burkholderiaceae bacterium]